ncbi:MAG TPA: hypothetical protein VKA46_40720 [Gemmataceae bacterium]|nr:hypothetical protein [Gemmataceae bacterium]
MAAEELLTLHTRVQGADHWETVNQKWDLAALKKVAALPEEKRLGWRAAWGRFTSGSAGARPDGAACAAWGRFTQVLAPARPGDGSRKFLPRMGLWDNPAICALITATWP